MATSRIRHSGRLLKTAWAGKQLTGEQPMQIDDLIIRSAISELWLPFVENALLDGETRIRWIACQFLAQLNILDKRPEWLDIDWLIDAYELRMAQLALV